MSDIKVFELLKSEKSIKFATVKDGLYYADMDINIAIPSFYFERGLASMSKFIETIGLFAIVNSKGEYMTLPLANQITLFSRRVSTREKYIHVIFSKGEPIMMEKISMSGSLVEKFFHEVIKKGKFPEFVTYEIARSLLNSISRTTDAGILKNFREVDLLLSVLGRQENNPKLYYRYAPDKIKAVFVNIEDRSYVRDNFAIFSTSYFKDGREELISRTANKEEIEASDVEKILRNK